MRRLSTLLNVPRLPKESWPPIYEVLSEYASSHRFSLTEATRWSRDRLVERGYNVSRGAVGFVTRGVAFGGRPLFRRPPPSAAELRDAFISNVLDRADAATIPLTPSEANAVREWLGGLEKRPPV